MATTVGPSGAEQQQGVALRCCFAPHQGEELSKQGEELSYQGKELSSGVAAGTRATPCGRVITHEPPANGYRIDL